MGHATQRVVGGIHVGWKCEFGHDHPSQFAAENCDTDKFSVTEREKLDRNDKQRVRQIQDHLDFKKALSDAKALGAADDTVAEEVVLRCGIEAVINARAGVLGLRIPEAKSKAPVKPEGSKPEGPPKP